MSKPLIKNQEILIYSRAILQQDTPDLTTLTPHQRHLGRVTVKLPSPVHKSGWRQVTVPISFISDPADSLDPKNQIMTVGQLRKALETCDESLPVCVSAGLGHKPGVKATYLEQQQLMPPGYVNPDLQKSEPSVPVVVLYT